MKNPTPRQIAIAVSVIAGLIILFTIIITGIFNLHNTPYWLAILIAITSAVGCYITNLNFMERFIYRKIKLLYKQIHQQKTSTNMVDENISMDDDIVTKVEDRVKQWSNEKQNKVDKVIALENYRKEYIGNVSHELKTPIFNIQGYIETLVNGGYRDEKVNLSYLLKANNNVDRLINIVEDLTVISQIESGQIELNLIKFNITQLSKDVFEELELQADSADIILNIKPKCDVPFYVIADKDRIRQVLTNLLTNSIRYGRDEGLTQVGFYDVDENILIEVSDNGIGIEEAHLPHLFDRFYRIDKGRARTQGGTGLGLAIVKHILEAHKQSISVRSTKGEGSTFGFTLEKA